MPNQYPTFCRMYFGAPGSGKTTFGVALARKAIKAGRPVFTNFPCVGAYQIDVRDLGKFSYRDALIIIDEAGIAYDSRNYKSMPSDVIQYLKLHRHYGVALIWLSQGWDDCDKKIRTLCTEYWYLRKLGPWTVQRLMLKRCGVDDNTHQIIDEYYRYPLLRGGLQLCYRPRWYKFYDSWDAPFLPDAPVITWDSTGAAQTQCARGGGPTP